MIDVCLLGCGGMMPLPHRYLTALLLKYNGSSLLIDCGEGTQIAIRDVGWSFKPIDMICFTHMHGDHISGLPGLLLTMANSDRTEPLTMAGPKGLERTAESLRVVARDLPFEIRYIEYDSPLQELMWREIRLKAFRVSHSIPCYGYSFELPRSGRFDVQRAQEAGIPLKYWSRLQKGETIEEEGQIWTPDMVLGPERKGLKLTYVTDTRPTRSITEQAAGSDLFICEGMYGDDSMIDKARENKHMMFREAATLARDAQVEEMWLTHYSPSLVRPQPFLPAARAIFPNTRAGKNGMTATLRFEDEKETT